MVRGALGNGHGQRRKVSEDHNCNHHGRNGSIPRGQLLLRSPSSSCLPSRHQAWLKRASPSWHWPPRAINRITPGRWRDPPVSQAVGTAPSRPHPGGGVSTHRLLHPQAPQPSSWPIHRPLGSYHARGPGAASSGFSQASMEPHAWLPLGRGTRASKPPVVPLQEKSRQHGQGEPAWLSTAALGTLQQGDLAAMGVEQTAPLKPVPPDPHHAPSPGRDSFSRKAGVPGKPDLRREANAGSGRTPDRSPGGQAIEHRLENPSAKERIGSQGRWGRAARLPRTARSNGAALGALRLLHERPS